MDIFALIILLILIAVVIVVWCMLAVMPGRIAASRNHRRFLHTTNNAMSRGLDERGGFHDGSLPY